MKKPALVVVCLVATPIFAQQSTPPTQQAAPAQQAPAQTQPASAPAAAPSDGKVRIFVTDSQSWEMSGGFGASGGNAGGQTSGGARPQTGEIIKTFGEKCPQYTITMNKEKADYVVLLDHEGGKGYARKDNKVAVFYKDGDSIFSHSTRALGSSVKDACDAIIKDQTSKKQ